MSLVSLVLDVDAKDADRLSDALLEAGALSVSAEDPNAGTPDEVPVYDEPDWNNGPVGQWPLLRLRVLVETGETGMSPDPRSLLSAAVEAAFLEQLPDYSIEPVEHEDWVRKTQSQFEPIKISERLWIVPSWHVAPNPHAFNIALDPGIAFGTGSHPTTKLCLRWLDSQIILGKSVLDYGCGSGILAITAAKLGATRVVGVDIDSAAIGAAQENARRNFVQVEFVNAGSPLELKVDLIVANILANPLKVLAPLLARYIQHGGRMALSGVLVSQKDEVASVYSPWFEFETGTTEDGWVCLSGYRKPVP